MPDKEVGDRRATSIARLRPITVAQLRSMPAPCWRVHSILQDKTLGMVWGATGSGKTFLVLDLGISVARGRRWFGKRVKQGGVIYIAGEGHLKLRLEAYCEQHEVGESDLESLRVLSASVNLLDPDADILPLLVALDEAAKDMGGVALVVLDTLNAMMPGGDENSSEDMGTLIAAARRIMGALDCAVILVHHGGKDESRGARGHSSLKAALDTEIYVKDGDGERTALVEKVRDGERGASFAFRLRVVDLGDSADPDAEPGERDSSCVIDQLGAPTITPKHEHKRDVALDSLREAIAEHGETMPGSSTLPAGVIGTRLEYWERRWLLRTGADYKDGDVGRSAFRRERLKLIRAGKAFMSSPWVWLG